MSGMIRQAGEDDISRITEIYADAVDNGTATYELEAPDEAEIRSRFRALKAANYPYLVYEDDGAVLGYAYAGPFRARPAYRFIVEDSIYIAPEAKGRGVGRALLEALIEACRHDGYRQFVAVIGDGVSGSPSVRLHRAVGMRLTGMLEGSGYKHGRWLDTAFMQMDLNGGASGPPDPDSVPEKLYQA
ncbi:N-acetyltransferase family protein, partial [Salmonella enterica subsp. enterica serovar Enteritidis]|nr:N-acetyltransferase family protein [Salmonella enterica subsp. enterica serovar Enteritidis]